MYLFTTPRAGKINEEQSDFLHTAYQEELKYENHRIMTYRWLGTKQTILLTHGWESNSARWKKLIIALKNKGFNVVALDAPAHGRSGSSVFNAICKASKPLLTPMQCFTWLKAAYSFSNILTFSPNIYQALSKKFSKDSRTCSFICLLTNSKERNGIFIIY